VVLVHQEVVGVLVVVVVLVVSAVMAQLMVLVPLVLDLRNTSLRLQRLSLVVVAHRLMVVA
jgi:hypothetical protein